MKLDHDSNLECGIRTFPMPGNSHNKLFNLVRENVIWDLSIKARKTASFGFPYNYSNIRYQYADFPYYIKNIVDDLEVLLGYRPNNCLLNFYNENSSYMGYHSDVTNILAPHTGISILSLGHGRKMSFRNILNKKKVSEVYMQPGWFLHMSSEIQHCWQHAILPSEKSDIYCQRISLTFRRLIQSEMV